MEMFSAEEIEIMRQFAETTTASGESKAIKIAMIIKLIQLVKEPDFIGFLAESNMLDKFTSDLTRMLLSIAQEVGISKKEINDALQKLMSLEKVIEPGFMRG